MLVVLKTVANTDIPPQMCSRRYTSYKTVIHWYTDTLPTRQ